MTSLTFEYSKPKRSSGVSIVYNCDRIWENPAYREIHKFLVSCIFDKLYHRANSNSSLRPIARFTEELQRFVCDCATPPIIEKLRKSIKWTWVEPFEMNAKIE